MECRIHGRSVLCPVRLSIHSVLLDPPPSLQSLRWLSPLFRTDVMVVCGEPQYAEDQQDTLLNPVLIVEVLSESTRDYDRGRKFQHYRKLPSLIEYLMIEQDEPHVEHWTRQQDNHWDFVEFDGLTQSLHLTSIGCTLPLTEVYDKIDFPV
jgi:Uma2 family endonuclease